MSPPPLSSFFVSFLFTISTNVLAIVVNCLPSFAVVVRRQIVSIRSRDGSNNKGSRSQSNKLSQQRHRLRAESVLLHDLAAEETNDGSKGSHDGDSEAQGYIQAQDYAHSKGYDNSRVGLAT